MKGANKIMVVGATSAIARSMIRSYASAKHALFLVGRDDSRLSVVARDARARGASEVSTLTMDIEDDSAHARVVETAVEALGGLDMVIVTTGIMPIQPTSGPDIYNLRKTMSVNAVSVMIFVENVIEVIGEKSPLTIVVFSSMAGERGRASNYVYGAGKAALDIFLQGLRGRLRGADIKVVTVKPALVHSPMTEECKKNALWVSADEVATDIEKCIDRGDVVIYTPRRWRFIMWVVRALPETLLHRLNI